MLCLSLQMPTTRLKQRWDRVGAEQGCSGHSSINSRIWNWRTAGESSSWSSRAQADRRLPIRFAVSRVMHQHRQSVIMIGTQTMYNSLVCAGDWAVHGSRAAHWQLAGALRLSHHYKKVDPLPYNLDQITVQAPFPNLWDGPGKILCLTSFFAVPPLCTNGACPRSLCARLSCLLLAW